MQHSWVKHSVCKPHSAEASKREKKIKKIEILAELLTPDFIENLIIIVPTGVSQYGKRRCASDIFLFDFLNFTES